MDGWIDTGDMLCEETVGEMIGMTDGYTGKVSDPESLSLYVGFDTPG